MISEICTITDTVSPQVQVIYKDDQGIITKVDTYDGKMARVILEVVDYVQELNEVKS